MILADKIIINRKKLNMTQEDLANEIGVSRQAVSKWEGALSIPDMDKIILLSNLFGVSVDYLIRDEIDDVEYLDNDQFSTHRQISLDEANDYLEKTNKSSNYISLGVLLIIFSPITLILLTSLADFNKIQISNDGAVGIGMAALLILVSIAVGIFILNDSVMKEYRFLENESFNLDYGVEGIVKQKQKSRVKENSISIVVGVVLIILSILPLLISNSFASNHYLNIYAVPILLFTISIGVYILVRNGVKESAYSKLLQAEDFTPTKKKNSKIYGSITSIYWLLATAIFLANSFIFNAWDKSWVIWPIAGVLFPIVLIVASMVIKDQ